jgi:hypothetical protein
MLQRRFDFRPNRHTVEFPPDVARNNCVGLIKQRIQVSKEMQQRCMDVISFIEDGRFRDNATAWCSVAIAITDGT